MLDEHDHRNLGKRLDLFHFQDEAPGMAFWHPRGFALYRVLEEAARRQIAAQGYREVRTPQLLRRAIWEQSGHWQSFPEGMFVFPAEEAALKPVSCPGHAQIFRDAQPSFRDLPLRLAEFGRVHRDEPSGTLHGLFRMREFTQDDGHVFSASPDAEGEIIGFCAGLLDFYRAFGFEQVEVGLSLRPAARAGSDAIWDQAEALLRRAAVGAGLDFREQPGAGAFYGPKLEFSLRDRLGRSWQCGTIQLDFVLPERFDLEYVERGGARVRPVLLHRALYGSLERFAGVLLEHHAGLLPAWLAPEQVVVAPVAAEHAGYARRVAVELAAHGLRARVDQRDDSLSRRVALAHEAGVPVFAVVGAREERDAALSLRKKSGSVVLPLASAIESLREECRPPV